LVSSQSFAPSAMMSKGWRNAGVRMPLAQVEFESTKSSNRRSWRAS
jgi:hypothetical protein